MSSRRLYFLPILVALLSACAQQSSSPAVEERGSADYFKVRDSIADEVYVDPRAVRDPGFNAVRKIYIAPANTATITTMSPRRAKRHGPSTRIGPPSAECQTHLHRVDLA